MSKSEERKTAFVIVRVFQTEKDKLIEQARKLSTNLSTYVRNKLFDEEV